MKKLNFSDDLLSAPGADRLGVGESQPRLSLVCVLCGELDTSVPGGAEAFKEEAQSCTCFLCSAGGSPPDSRRRCLTSSKRA